MGTNKILESASARHYVSSPAASPSVSWRAAEARFYSWRKLENGHKHFFIHTRASLVIRFSLVRVGRNCNGLNPDVNLLDGGLLGGFIMHGVFEMMLVSASRQPMVDSV